MPQSASGPNSGNIAVTIVPNNDGRCICEATCSLDGRTGPTKSFQGQNPKHAIAIALEDLAREFRKEAEAEQGLDWEAVDRSPSRKVNEKRFHVILHFEHVIEEESKFEAMVSTQLGNTVVECAEISIIQVDPDLQIAT